MSGRVLTFPSPGAAASGGSSALRFSARAALQAEEVTTPRPPPIRRIPTPGLPSGPTARVRSRPTDETSTCARRPRARGYETRGAAVTAAFSCADAGSGIASCTGTAADGTPVEYRHRRLAEFVVTAVDRAGNQTVVRHAYEVAAPAEPTPTPSPTPTATPTATPTPKPKVEVKSEQSVSLGLPASRRCVSRRRPDPAPCAQGHAAEVRPRVGRRQEGACGPQGGRLVATIDLRGLRKGRFAVLVRAVTTDGRKVRDKRSYKTCAKRRTQR